MTTPDPAFSYALLAWFALLVGYLLRGSVRAWRARTRVRTPPHTEWVLRIDDEGHLDVRTFDGCGCPIGVDHWRDGEPHRD